LLKATGLLIECAILLTVAWLCVLIVLALGLALTVALLSVLRIRVSWLLLLLLWVVVLSVALLAVAASVLLELAGLERLHARLEARSARSESACLRVVEVEILLSLARELFLFLLPGFGHCAGGVEGALSTGGDAGAKGSVVRRWWCIYMLDEAGGRGCTAAVDIVRGPSNGWLIDNS
jgi:hypothetical protein